MSNVYRTQVLQPKHTPQTVRADPREVRNHAGGYVYQVSDWKVLDRFLILGTEASTYYVGKTQLTAEHAATISGLIAQDGPRVVRRIVELVDRCPKRSPSLFALSLAIARGDAETRKVGYEAMLEVCRTGSDLLEFQSYLEPQKGWGRQRRRMTSQWYLTKSHEDLAYQLVKYRNRSGWTHADVLRMAHAKPTDSKYDQLFKWATGKPGADLFRTSYMRQIGAYELAKTASEAELLKLIAEYRMTWEMLPTEALSHASVWSALLQHMPMRAMVRNLGRMTALGMFASHTSRDLERVHTQLRDPKAVSGSHIHPFALFLALKTYELGHGVKGGLTWNPNVQIVDALDEAFHLAFGNQSPTGKNRLIAVDVSGSMQSAMISAGVCTAQEAAIALAMCAVHQEYVTVIGFSAESFNYRGANDHLRVVPLSRRQRLTDAICSFDGLYNGGTDCGLPFQFAIEQFTKSNVKYDSIEIYTDSETWAGQSHASELLRDYRRFNPDVKVVMASTAPNGFSVVDPNDRNVLQIVGFDAAGPQIIDAFLTGGRQYEEDEE